MAPKRTLGSSPPKGPIVFSERRVVEHLQMSSCTSVSWASLAIESETLCSSMYDGSALSVKVHLGDGDTSLIASAKICSCCRQFCQQGASPNRRRRGMAWARSTTVSPSRSTEQPLGTEESPCSLAFECILSHHSHHYARRDAFRDDDPRHGCKFALSRWSPRYSCIDGIGRSGHQAPRPHS